MSGDEGLVFQLELAQHPRARAQSADIRWCDLPGRIDKRECAL